MTLLKVSLVKTTIKTNRQKSLSLKICLLLFRVELAFYLEPLVQVRVFLVIVWLPWQLHILNVEKYKIFYITFNISGFFIFLFYFGVELINNAVLYTGIYQSGSVLYIYIYIYIFFFKFFSHLYYYRVLSRVPCATQ